SPFPCAKINCEPPSAVRVVIYCDPTTFPERIRRVWDSFAVGDQVRNPLAYPQARGGTRRNKHRLFDYSVMPRGRTRGTCNTRRIPLERELLSARASLSIGSTQLGLDRVDVALMISRDQVAWGSPCGVPMVNEPSTSRVLRFTMS